MTRRFEFVGGTSAKFWAVTVADKQVTARYGRLGTEGQINTKDFGSAEQAQRHADNLIGQKLAKGYTECVPA